ncbi:hyptothatical protein [Blumeria hordei DH14]|uniref:Hyptothatical protein n=1 Tax=Blumeria graminis f. sp. hordei (strain DH14) TaxID=546991 RepID=N1JE82_BLUG1|nr:hyptothatical protein [Blumeria hordei DH14]
MLLINEKCLFHKRHVKEYLTLQSMACLESFKLINFLNLYQINAKSIVEKANIADTKVLT